MKNPFDIDDLAPGKMFSQLCAQEAAGNIPPPKPPPSSAPGILEAGAQHMKDRGQTYDAPSGERSMKKTVDMFNILKGDDYFTTELGWLFMAILKMVRSQQGDFRLDNYEDMVAYCALAGEQGSRERVNEQGQ